MSARWWMVAIVWLTACTGPTDYQPPEGVPLSEVRFGTPPINELFESPVNSVVFIVYRSDPDCPERRCKPSLGHLSLDSKNREIVTSLASDSDFIIRASQLSSNADLRAWCEADVGFRPQHGHAYTIHYVLEGRRCTVLVRDETDRVELPAIPWE